jgi:hypothetical protein
VPAQRRGGRVDGGGDRQRPRRRVVITHARMHVVAASELQVTHGHGWRTCILVGLDRSDPGRRSQMMASVSARGYGCAACTLVLWPEFVKRKKVKGKNERGRRGGGCMHANVKNLGGLSRTFLAEERHLRVTTILYQGIKDHVLLCVCHEGKQRFVLGCYGFVVIKDTCILALKLVSYF